MQNILYENMLFALNSNCRVYNRKGGNATNRKIKYLNIKHKQINSKVSCIFYSKIWKSQDILYLFS